MASIQKKRPHASSSSGSKPRPSTDNTSTAGPSKTQAAPRPAPAFVSSLKNEEVDFPRGGGSSLTAFELKQTRDEGRREAEAEAQTADRPTKRVKRGLSERERKRAKKNEVDIERKERDKDQIRVDHLNYKRCIPGTHILTRVHTVLPLHLILSLPNNLLAHVPITEISQTLTSLLSAEEADTSDDEDEEEEEEDDAMSTSRPAAPDLSQLFAPGQYFPAKVLNLYPTASQSFISQYPVTETIRLAAKVEMTLMPEKVNAEVGKGDVEKGLGLVGEVRGEEDKGWRVGLGLADSEGMSGWEGWVSKEDVEKHSPSKTLIPGQLLPCSITSLTAGGRVVNLTLDRTTYLRSALTEVHNVASLLPGHQVSALITAVIPSSGLNLKVCGFFDGTIDLAHLGLAPGQDIEEKYKIGKKLRARVIYDNLSTTPRKFALSILPHVMGLTSPMAPDGKGSLEETVKIGSVLNSVRVTRVMPEWGVFCRTEDGLEGFVHISHVSDERIPALSGSVGPYRVDTLHRARVIGHSPLDGTLLLSFEQKVLDQVFMNVDELRVGQVLKGTIHKLTDKALFVNIHGSVDGVVWPLHYADIRLKHPEKRFRPGGTVRCRVFALEPTRNRVTVTLKKSLVDSEHATPASFAEVKSGMITSAVVTKILDKGCIVDIFGGLRAFVPQSEASQNFIANLSDIFFVGKTLTVRITTVDPVAEKLVASVRQALPSALAAESLSVGDTVSGLVAQVHAEQIALSLVPSQLTALLSLSNLSHHRGQGIDELRKSLKVGEKLEDLVVISKDTGKGLLIVANKRVVKSAPSSSAITGAGISAGVRSIEDIKAGTIVPGRVLNQTPQGTVIQLTSHLRGRVHPCDVSDDFSVIADGTGPLQEGADVMCYVLKSNPATRIIDLSTRKSRVDPANAGEVADPEIWKVEDVEVGKKVRGVVKNVSDHGVFVALGRGVTARVMIKEMFDEFVKDWQSRFEVNQLVEGSVLSIDTKRGLIEMSLRKNPGVSRGGKGAAKAGLDDFTVGQKVDATVQKVEDYGMFLQIEGSNVRGLCHRSEIAENKKQDVSQALKGFREGDKVRAMIVGIDKEKGRVNFGVKASYFADEVKVADEDEDVEEEEEDGSEAGEWMGAGEDKDDDEGEEDDEEDEDEDMSGEEGDEDAEDDDDEELEDDDEAEEGSDDGIELDLSAPPARAAAPKATSSKAANSKLAAALTVAGGFDWNGDAVSDADSASSSSEAESELASTSKPSSSKKKSKSAALSLTGTAPSGRPESSTEFERALLASPNSSFLWIQYMSFLLQLHEVDKARRIGRQALERINYREEEEKLNVWMALVNLEIGFGTTDSADKVFKEAGEFNDKKTVWTRYAEALTAAGTDEAAEELFRKMVKKFSAHPDSWLKAADWFLQHGKVDEARELLPRAMKSLDKSKHVETIEKMALLEFKHGDAERGKTLFEGLMDRYPKRLDLWSVYIDQLAKLKDVQGVRGLFDRALDQKLTGKKAKFLFKKWHGIEGRIGDEAGQKVATERARKWVEENSKQENGGDDREEDEDEEDE